MIISILRKNKIRKLTLPNKIYGTYWITDDDNQNLISIEAKDSKWVLKSNYDTKIINNNYEIDSINLEDYSFYYLKQNNEKEYIIIYCAPSLDNSYTKLSINTNSFTIGTSENNAIVYKNNFIAANQLKINYQNGFFEIENMNPACSIYVNDIAITKTKLSAGDIIFIMGLKIIIMSNFIVINNPSNKMTYNSSIFSLKQEIIANKKNIDTNSINKDDNYFLKSPRFRSSIEPIDIKIDAPPKKENMQDIPLLFTMGPMITMGMTSMVSLYSAIMNIFVNNYSVSKALPSIVIAVAMLMTMILWPTLTKKYTKKQKIKREKLRQIKYIEYLEEKRKFINNTISKQKQILLENNVSLEECANIINLKKTTLWEREIEHDDFLTIRIGMGKLNPSINITAPEEHFSIDGVDNLETELNNLINETHVMDNVPISVSLVQKNITAIVGNNDLTKSFIDGLILQLVTFHSYDDLKLVIFTSEENKEKWDYLKILPHSFNDSKSIRFFATNVDEMKQVSNYLEKIFVNRKYKDDSQNLNNIDYKSFSPYYVIITDNLKVARNIEIVKRILEQKLNIGFSLIIKNNRLSNLPNECSTFINIGEKTSGLFENELISNKQKEFIADINTNLPLTKCATKLANIPIEMNKTENVLPKTISFLQMYNVGKVEQLNPLNRWKTNNPTISLQVPVGVDNNGELFKLDLHEKFHGPHGLVAGMTGSGKSEFILSYILSLAVNFHPNEVQFVIIDYKGGGLAGALYNKETGVKLPHLAGTITNLDTIEMKRSLASIQSELKRRQRLFNEARDNLNESTIDIYKYQRLYRDGRVKTPISHLFIISDEFAELKSQQPEFMDQLISTARIGRSLGVHLILATQKPSGVVNDQIWSNSKFKICLKVQDKSDSNDMIKRPDAALLKQAGRFYLLVGYNEYFALGQSAWAGAQYFPTDKVKKKIDTSINFIDNIGNVYKVVVDDEVIETNISKGEELPNIVSYLSDIAKEQNIDIPKLWLDKIPDTIYINDLKKKYNHNIKKGILNPIIGEYDDPDNQRQGLLTLPITREGNTIIFGSTGSGKENLLTSIIFSTISEHTVNEVNFYILDFGAETLKIFAKTPHVGDVLLNNQTDKICNLFKMLKFEIEERKKLFNEYNGNYTDFINKSNKVIPQIVTIINNYEAFNELYSNYDEDLLMLTREGLKYGIIFIITSSNINTIRYKLKQNFKQIISLQMNDTSDYRSIFSSNNTIPSKIFGRGIIELGNIYEFQTAYVYEYSKINDYLKLVNTKLIEAYKTKAPVVPILPDKVTIDFVKGNYRKNMIPVGIRKDNLKIETMDYSSKISIISSFDQELFKPFIGAFSEYLSNIDNVNVAIIDANNLINNKKSNVSYYNDNFKIVLNKMQEYILKQISSSDIEDLKKAPKTICLIIGIDKFIKSLDANSKTVFEILLEKVKEYPIFNFILIDTIDSFKSIEYEPWYKTCINNNYGIWLGNGIADQYTLKLTKTTREMREEISNDFGYIIKNGNATLIKTIYEQIIEEDKDE